jgi:hypothetical protein
MADPIARRPEIRRMTGRGVLNFVSHLVRPALVTAVLAVPIAGADAPAVLPLACGITWTTVGQTVMFLPDCAHPVPGGPPPYPPDPPPDPGAPPGPPPPP